MAGTKRGRSHDPAEPGKRKELERNSNRLGAMDSSTIPSSTDKLGETQNELLKTLNSCIDEAANLKHATKDTDAVHNVEHDRINDQDRDAKMAQESEKLQETVLRSEPEPEPKPIPRRRPYATRQYTRSQAPGSVQAHLDNSKPGPLTPLSAPTVQPHRKKMPAKGDHLHVLWHVDNIYYPCTVDKILNIRRNKFYDLTYDTADRDYFVDLTVRKWFFADKRYGNDVRGRDREVHEIDEPLDESKFPKCYDKVLIMWHVDGKYYPGVVRDVLCENQRLFHDITYDEGDEEFFLDLKVRKWRFQETPIEDHRKEAIHEYEVEGNPPPTKEGKTNSQNARKFTRFVSKASRSMRDPTHTR